ncbi:damage-inducible protein DinB [Henriciella barbarensis]|uniref:Damage-inducible protein DinB n=1 Tax=Henriciella barbarensis TaxID=86342 RepID=A0A399R895_9PROT|nr:DinB family protein [Henriciella barbarensis]RIJ25892.1 damage-inducible protein DinB [Henriciella barbarensis]
MIMPDQAHLMARYNRWQNESLYSAADSLDHSARLEDRGAFFRSIHETLAHILWADRIWLSRFGMCEKPTCAGHETLKLWADWEVLQADRMEMDDVIDTWTDGFSESDLRDRLEWYSGAAERTLSKPVWLLVTHIFNHQTHHRGQVHAMLTAAGSSPDDTDLFLMEGEV